MALTPVAGPYPNLATIVQPNPAPTFPPGFDLFSPPVNASAPPAGTPILTRVAPPIGRPDDTLILTGEQLSNFTGSRVGKDVSLTIYGQSTSSNGVEATGLVQRLGKQEVAATLPPTLPINSMYLVWPRNSTGYGRPVAINRTEVWWLGLNARVTRGSTIAVHGRNLSKDQGVNASHVFIKPADSAGQWAAVTSINPYRVAFTVPTHLPNGNYEVWVHNTHGGAYGWSGPLTLRVSDPWLAASRTFNVGDCGAGGVTGGDDDAPSRQPHSSASDSATTSR